MKPSRPSPPSPAPRTARRESGARRWGPVAAFVLAAAGGGAAYGVGCSHHDEGEERPSSEGRQTVVEEATATASDSDPGERSVPTSTATAKAEKPVPPSSATAPVVDASYSGPLLGAMAIQTPIYPEMRFSDERLGYIRQGGKVPVDAKPVKKTNCKEGWYHLLEGGYVCGKYATLNMEEPRVKLGIRQPDVASTVPYQYAYNLHHGTPLYKGVPTRDEMLKVEPYLLEKEKEKKEKAAKKKAEDSSEPDPGAGSSSPAPADGDRPKGKHPASEDGNVPSGDSSEAKAAVAAMTPMGTLGSDEGPTNEPPKPWWQTGEKNPNVSLADLEKDAAGNLSKRMVKGFFVAIDKTLSVNDRAFYRTTGGLLAPADRMVVNKPPATKGIDWPEGAKAVFFALSDKTVKLELGKDGKKLTPKGKLPRHGGIGVTDKTLELEGSTYRETVDGLWVKESQGTITQPGARPKDVGENERWVDVNLDKKTLVLFEGDKPVYAALISPGKHSRNKKKNHATPTGSYRIREKHIAVTMDGDGAAGDLPYSIEDVPYVAYFKGSYALHAAFWHDNFGREMSHGCVNLSPLDAKVVFNFVEPRLPRGWHGAFATPEHPGSLVVLHE